MMETLIIVLIVLWLMGIFLHVTGGLIHVLIVIALVLFIYRLVSGRNL